MKQKIRTVFISLIIFYQKTISPDKGFLKQLGFFRNPTCVFYPSCSEYAKEAVNKYGVFKGSYFSLCRVLRCHPWVKNHIDPLK